MIRAIPKQKPFRSKHYLDWIKSKPCCVCLRPGPSDPHHYQLKGQGKMGGTVGDNQALPTCRYHHGLFHSQGRGKWADWGLDPEWLITKYNEDYTLQTGRSINGQKGE